MAPRRPQPAPVLAHDDHRQRLTELRDLLTAAVQAGPPAAYMAPLCRQLQSVLHELATMPAPAPTDAVAALKQRSKDRMAALGIPEAPRRTPNVRL